MKTKDETKSHPEIIKMEDGGIIIDYAFFNGAPDNLEFDEG